MSTIPPPGQACLANIAKNTNFVRMKFNIKSIISLVSFLAIVSPVFAIDDGSEPPDDLTVLTEELALIRDSYVAVLNEAMEATIPEDTRDLGPWFRLRDSGKAATWADLGFEVPNRLQHLKVEEIPYGMRITGSVGKYKGGITLTVVTRDTDIFYDRVFDKGTSADYQNVALEIFRNDRVVYYKDSTPCKKRSVTCIQEYKQGTLGNLKK